MTSICNRVGCLAPQGILPIAFNLTFTCIFNVLQSPHLTSAQNNLHLSPFRPSARYFLLSALEMTPFGLSRFRTNIRTLNPAELQRTTQSTHLEHYSKSYVQTAFITTDLGVNFAVHIFCNGCLNSSNVTLSKAQRNINCFLHLREQAVSFLHCLDLTPSD